MEACLKAAAAETPAEASLAAFAGDCIEGLSRPRKSLPCKWLYDDVGSQLFERITALPEYYPSRTEEALLGEVAPYLGGPAGPRTLVELGSGASRKTRALLACMSTVDTYIPIDISEDELGRAQAAIRGAFPRLMVVPVCADFTAPGALDLRGLQPPVLLFFPGSTLGNMAPLRAADFLTSLRIGAGPDARLLLGVDLLKDERTLLAAYDDAEGVTAAFNLNLLERMRREIGAVIDVAAFRHRAVWNAAGHRIEMHLEALSRQTIGLYGRSFVVERGETIHTENSYKLTARHWQEVFETAGWRVEAEWRSPAPEFLVALLTAADQE